MKRTLRRIVYYVLKAYREFKAADMPVYAANAALFLEIAAFPLLILLLSILRYFPMLDAEELKESMLELFPAVPEISAVVSTVAVELERESSAAVSWFSGLTALFSASTGVVAVLKGLGRLYRCKEQFWMKYRLVAVAYTAALLVVVLASLGAQLSAKLAVGLLNSHLELPVLRQFSDRFILQMKYLQIFTKAAAFLVVLELYRFPFGKNQAFKDRLPGAVFASVSWFLAAKVFSFAIGRFWKPSVIYGSLTAIILLAYWGYTIMTILFLGAALNKAIPDREE